jgi:hypothetical protein
MLSVAFAILMSALPAQDGSAELSAVLARAIDYVRKYEEELGNLIATEEYVQSAQWRNAQSRYSMISQKKQRRTSSDFLILQVGSEWEGVRKVNVVDGLKVKAKEPSFAEVFDDSPRANYQRLQEMIAESTEYNIGDVVRQMNLPTFPLRILRREHFGRFTFTKLGIDKVDGVQAWSIRFKEVDGPTLVRDPQEKQFLFSYGVLLIEPNTGRILRTIFEVEDPFAKPKIRARMVVNYTKGKKIDMLVPSVMTEHYETDYSSIECRADYLNFRRFEVDVKFEIGNPKP